jgi:hypothetical protein
MPRQSHKYQPRKSADKDLIELERVRALRTQLDAEVTLPDLAGTGLEGSPYAREAWDMLRSGYLPGKVQAMLAERHHVEVPLEGLKELLARTPKEAVLPATALMQHFLSVNLITDPFEKLTALLRITEERLSAAMLAEDLAEEPETRWEYTKMVESYIDLYWKRLIEYQGLRKTLPLGDSDATLPGQTKAPTLGDLMKDAYEVTLRERTATISRKGEDDEEITTVDGEVRRLEP